MKNFEINRFWKTYKWFFCENSKQLIKWFFIITLAIALLEILLCTVILQSPKAIGNELYIAAVKSSSMMSIFIIIIANIFVESSVFDFMKTKQKRIAFLTLPATNMERWITVMIHTCIVFPIILFLGYYFGDFLRNVVFFIQGKEWISGEDSWSVFFGTMEYGEAFINTIHEYTSFLWSISVCILCGTWFRKGQFVFSNIILITTFSLIYIILRQIDSNFLDMLSASTISQEPVKAWALVIVEIATTIFNFWLSYRIFKRFQIITPKWTNI